MMHHKKVFYANDACIIGVKYLFFIDKILLFLINKWISCSAACNVSLKFSSLFHLSL
jgi:hypothetical protein